MLRKEDPFNDFSPLFYLQEYYGEIGEENRFILSFLDETYQSWQPATLWDIGGGPTIYQLISASRVCERIRIFESLEPNRNAVQAWLNREPGRFDWKSYFEFLGDLEGVSPEVLESRLRTKIQSVEAIDLFNKPSIPATSDFRRELPDGISTHFCVESITSDPELFDLAWDNLMELVPTGGGYLIMSLLKNATSYSAGPYSFPAFPVSEDEIKSRLKKKGFHSIEMQSVPAEHGRDYQGIICVRAIRE